MLENFIKSNFNLLLEKLKESNDDSYFIEHCANKTLSNEIVKKWMTDYNLFQGRNKQERIELAQAFINFNETIIPDKNFDLKENFKTLHSELSNVVERKWISATSKLLWTIRPNDVAMYDSFAVRSLMVLQSLDKDLGNFPILGSSPKYYDGISLNNLTDHFMNYQNMVKSISFKYQQLITELCKKNETEYKYQIRIIDKFLWIMGDFKANIKY